jgi:hypothetical protein
MIKRALIALLLTLLAVSTITSAGFSKSDVTSPNSNIAKIFQQDTNLETQIQLAAYCPKQGEQRAGQNKICYYRCLSGTVAITISAISMCPLSINR